VRYLHHLAREQTSDGAYRGTTVKPRWLDTRVVEKLITRSGVEYERLMGAPPSIDERRVFELGGAVDPRVAGDAEFLASLPRPARTYRTTTTLEQVIDTVACRLGVERTEVLSGSRRREVALARALIAWYAAERHVATLAEVSRRLRRDPSTLSVGITRSRRRRPELFDLQGLHDLAPLVPSTARAWTQNDPDGKGMNDASHS
jgi:hypothetical protein